VGLVFLRQRESTVFGVAVALFWAVVLTIIMHIVLTRTRWGLHTVSVGGNLLGAREAGINVNRIKYGNFMLTGLLGATAMLSGTGSSRDCGRGERKNMTAAPVPDGGILRAERIS
jgi:ribose/xylose/arabinose/galactoside ABC-type transport system permease subunit